MTETPTYTEQSNLRAQRFAGILAGYEAEGPDGSVPGATSIPQRYALVTESLRGHGYFINYCQTLADIEVAAAANISEGWQPVCYYDLDELAGDEPPLYEGDRVIHNGVEKWVTATETDVQDGEPFDWLYLHPTNPQAHYDESEKVDESEVTIIERGMEDERNPKRYLVAGIRTIVVFNTEPAAP